MSYVLRKLRTKEEIDDAIINTIDKVFNKFDHSIVILHKNRSLSYDLGKRKI